MGEGGRRTLTFQYTIAGTSAAVGSNHASHAGSERQFTTITAVILAMVAASM